MPPGYPGYTSLCPMDFVSLLTPWVAVIGSLGWGLWIETALLIVVVIWFRLKHTAPRGRVLTLIIVAVAALVVTVADHQVAQGDMTVCQIALTFNQHYSLRVAGQIYQKMDVYVARANTALWLAAGLFVLGSFLAARVFVLGWRGRRALRLGIN